MPKTANCETCLYYALDSHLVCAIHPDGYNNDFCPDFQAHSDLEIRKFVDFPGLLQVEGDRNRNEPYSDEEQWEPKGASYYNGELILQREQQPREEQLWLLDNHPLFTSVCPQCGALFEQDYQARVHWDCSCG